MLRSWTSCPLLDVEAVAGRGIAVSDEHTLGVTVGDLDLGHDPIAAAADIGGDIGGEMAHPGPEFVVGPIAVDPCRVEREPLGETIIEWEDLVGFGLLPPAVDHHGEPFGVVGGPIVDLGEVLVEVVELPDVVVDRGAGRVVGHRLPPVDPDAAVAEHLEVLHLLGGGRGTIVEGGGEARPLDRLLCDTPDLGRWVDADHLEDRRHHVADVGETVAQLAPRLDPSRPRDHQRDHGPRRCGCSACSA